MLIVLISMVIIWLMIMVFVLRFIYSKNEDNKLSSSSKEVKIKNIGGVPDKDEPLVEYLIKSFIWR